MNPLLAAINYEIFPPINAVLNSLSTILLITGVILIKSGRKDAHRNVMVGIILGRTALASVIRKRACNGILFSES